MVPGFESEVGVWEKVKKEKHVQPEKKPEKELEGYKVELAGLFHDYIRSHPEFLADGTIIKRTGEDISAYKLGSKQEYGFREQVQYAYMGLDNNKGVFVNQDELGEKFIEFLQTNQATKEKYKIEEKASGYFITKSE